MKIKLFVSLITTLFFLQPNAYSQPLRSKYFIAIKKKEPDALNHLDSFKVFLPPKQRFYADPMLFKYQGINYIFFEDFNYQKGSISYVTVDENLNCSKAHCVLDMPFHLSFPFVFEDNGNIYMTPESYQINSVVLYRATHFPDKWEKVKTLVSGKDFVDPIIFKHNGYYWLFTASAFNNSQMYIYYAQSLDGPFQEHPINKTCISGRNAGFVFYSQGRLIRPVMDNTKVYGYSMVLKEIIQLTPTEFIEKEIHRIEPSWAKNLTGTHTLCIGEDLILYDGRRDIAPSEDSLYSSDP